MLPSQISLRQKLGYTSEGDWDGRDPRRTTGTARASGWKWQPKKEPLWPREERPLSNSATAVTWPRSTRRDRVVSRKRFIMFLVIVSGKPRGGGHEPRVHSQNSHRIRRGGGRRRGQRVGLRLSAWTSLRMEASTARSTENLQATLDISGRYSIGTWNDHGK